MGIYGTQGVADPANAPGSREWAAAWADAGGNLWLFGGTGYSAVDSGGLNDLWKYDGANWTWVLGSNLSNQPGVYGTKGVADPANHPGAASAAGTWVDSGGKFWLLSGSLWEFDPLTLLWTWVSGSQVQPQGGVYGTQGIPDPANVPGSRGCTATWVDPEDNLWLYGGVGYDWDGMRGTLGDLWKFDTSTLMWTWISGSKTAAWKNDGNPTGLPAIYGTKGVPDPTSFPGSRLGAVSWADAGGPLWLFGGVASHWTATDDQLHNDLWKFDPLTREWTWVSGSNAMAQPGIYGTKGVADASNIPGARKYAVSWTDPDGNFWLFGGFGYYAAGQTGYLNDLWKFDPITQEWTWVSGSDIGDQPGYFGPKGHNLASNMPPARVKAASWVDAAGNLWLFGGGAYWSFQSQACESNDLWRYTR
jgi:N-acetylneuraminic acid mutarotase